MKAILMLVIYCLSSSLWSETAGELLQTKLNAMHSMSASFNQSVKAKYQSLSDSRGSMALQKPGRFRWQTKSPMEQLVIADGKKIWVYDTDLEQVTVKKQEKGLSGSAALFLSGDQNRLTQDFDVNEKKEGAVDVFYLKAKSAKANFPTIQLSFAKDQLIALVLHDQLGQITSVKLSAIQSNTHLPAALFEFKTPKGVDVVNQ